METAVEIRGLVKTFGQFRAVDGLDLTVRTGTCHGVVGPNGAGKSTTLGMTVGLITPDAGTIRLLGHEVRAARALLGVLPEGLDLPERLTGAELLRYTAGLRGLDPAVAKNRSAELIEVLGLTKGAGTPLADCSTGTRKKIGLAQALVHAPRLLVLDEPFEAVDPVSALAIRRVLQRFVAGGGTTVLSTHSMLLVEQMCDDVTVVHRGKVVAAGPVSGVAAGGTLEDRFVELVGADVVGAGSLDWLTQ
ncbi:ABC transporter ATP-binding protein [Actinoplanes sp. TRM 88003]|uniref:ABC transporter ATP-binding protein n=1 Tax=Paractinoplanes aksuensis TaxID=2939490 RepID=A0ABT1DI65_9ACTN|nr:ATP-binding cassette domain-containing protein [Actinoplanes aksuensis]MCO8270495.1 ABC transporter ATP-binding protein [Actinoplanes aksuensis]